MVKLFNLLQPFNFIRLRSFLSPNLDAKHLVSAMPIQTYARTETLSSRLASKLVASDLLHAEALDAGAGAALAELCLREKPMLSSLAPVQACTQREVWVGGAVSGTLGVLLGLHRRVPIHKASSSARRFLARWQKLATVVQLAVHEVEKLAFAFPAQTTRWHVDRLVACSWCHVTAIVHIVSERLGRGRVPAAAIKRAFRRAVEARDGQPPGEACIKLLEEALLALRAAA